MIESFFNVAPPRSILVICTGHIGDVLLSTPVVRSLKLRWPDVSIDVLVFIGTEGALENNPDIRRTIPVASHANVTKHLGNVLKFWRRYDLACALRTSSVASFYCWVAGRKRIGVVAPDAKRWIKQRALNRFVIDRDQTTHVVCTGAALMKVLGIPFSFEVVPPSMSVQPEQLAKLNLRLAPTDGKPFMVVHMYPRYAYKMWHASGWIALIRFLHDCGYAVVLTGGPTEAEMAYARDIAERADRDVINLVGKTSLGETAEIIRRAKLYVGPDTSASHVAAATGTPTIALFGPSNPVQWGPWPKGWIGDSPWKLSGSAHKGNVYLIQGTGACVPCKLHGCERSVHSKSDCLLSLDAKRVINASSELLNVAPTRRRRIPVIQSGDRPDSRHTPAPR